MELNGSGDRGKVIEGADDRVPDGAGGYARARTGSRRSRARSPRSRAVRRSGRGNSRRTSGCRLRPVNPRASLTALIAASVPEETRRTSSMEGTASTISSASSTSRSVGGAERGPFGRRRLYRRDDLGVCVAEDERPPGHDPVEITTALGVLEVGARGAADEERLLQPNCAHGANRRVDPAGDDRLCAAEARGR